MKFSIFAAMLLAPTISQAVAQPGSKWTLETSIAVRTFVPESGTQVQAQPDENNFAVNSPDGSRFFVVTERGDLTCDCRTNELIVFATRDAVSGLARGRKPKALRRMEMQSAYGGSALPAKAIHAPHWEDNDSIVFISAKAAFDRGVYRLSVDSGAVNRLTDARYIPIDLAQGLNVGRKNGLFLGVDMAASAMSRKAFEYPFAAVSDQRMTDLHASLGSPELRQLLDRRPYGLYMFGDGKPTRLIARGKLGAGLDLYGSWLSPDESQAIIAWGGIDRSRKPTWAGYDRPEPSRTYQFMRVDLTTGEMTPILDAPLGFSGIQIAIDSIRKGIGGSADAFWSSDNRHVLLVNSAVPLSSTVAMRQSMSYLIDYDVNTGAWHVIEPFEFDGRFVKSVRWREPGKSLVLTYANANGAAVGTAIYSATPNGWIKNRNGAVASDASSGELALEGGLIAELRQGPNMPQRIIMKSGKRELDLLGPDPALARKIITPSRLMSWTLSGGTRFEGLLLLPDDASTGKPVPLVLQPYSVHKDKFEPDGFIQDSWASQTLAANGMAVLMIDIPLAGNIGGERTNIEERRLFRDMVDAVVDDLSRKGLIDAKKVGMIGYSRSGYFTHYLVTHPGKTRLAAVRMADSFTGGYGEYVSDVAQFIGLSEQAETAGMAAGHEYSDENLSFWRNKETWLAETPGFNVEKSQTPALFSLNGTAQIDASASETIAAWTLNRRPIEYLIFPDAMHGGLSRPRQWYESMKASVEWMGFWLMGKAPEDPERRRRWEQMRADWDVQRAWEAAGNPPGSKPTSPSR